MRRLRWFLLLSLALPLSGCVDLNAHEPVPDVAQPDASLQPIYDRGFGSFTDGGDCHGLDATTKKCVDFVSVATGGGDVFVSTGGREGCCSYTRTRIEAFDGSSLAYERTIDHPDLSQPRGVAYYRGELFVIDEEASPLDPDGGKQIFVFDPGTGALKRKLEHPVKLIVSDFAVDRLSLTGIDAAWGELWIAFAGGAGGGGVTVLDSQTGAVKGVYWNQPRYDCSADPLRLAEDGDRPEEVCQTGAPEDIAAVWHGCADPFATPVLDVGRCQQTAMRIDPHYYLANARTDPSHWWDIATVPELKGVVAQCRFTSRGDLIQPTPTPTVDTGELTEGTGCRRGGIDAVWGMRWLLAVEEPLFGGPVGITEYSLDNDGTELRVQARRRWQARLNSDPYIHYDVAYQPRETRIDWNGKLATQEWLRGTHCVNYLVSDADIYVVGGSGERWYEQARGFQKIEFYVDGVERLPEQTTPSGQFCFDTNTIATGRHTVTLKAWVNNGTKTATVSNDSANFDHDGPTGSVTSPGDVVTGPVVVQGAMVDPHSGSRNWTLEASLGGGAWQSVCTVSGESQGVNQWAPTCTWDAGGPAYPEGVYRLRGRMDDMVTPANGGSNVSYTAPVTVRVDRTPPSATLSGELKDAEDLRPLYDDDAPSVSVTAGDTPGSGVRRLEFLVDSVQRDSGEQTCPGGDCAMTRTFTLRPGEYAEGNHVVTVRVVDHAGHTRDYQWEISIERLFAPDPEGTDLPPDSAARSALPSGDVTNGVLFENATVEESPIPANELLPCAGENEATGFPVYSVGPVFEGLPMKLSYRRCDVPWPEEVVRANFVSFLYGDCTPPEGIDAGGCAPPLEIQSWPTCERNLGSIEPMPSGETLEYSQIQVNGVPAASFDGGFQVEVFTGRTTVVVFGADTAQVLRAAAAIQAQPQDDPLAFPATARSNDPLPDPIPGIVEGDISCV